MTAVGAPIARRDGHAKVRGDVIYAYDYEEAGTIHGALKRSPVAAGRIVLTHASVAEAGLVREADGGIVLATPFRQADCDRAVADLAVEEERRRRWQDNAAAYGSVPARYGRAAELARRIEMARDGGYSSPHPLGQDHAPVSA